MHTQVLDKSLYASRLMCVLLLRCCVLPAVGPLLGGVLSQLYGWRSTFICLAVFAGGIVMPLLVLVVSTATDG